MNKMKDSTSLKDDVSNDYYTRFRNRMSMVTRTDLDDNTRVDVLDFVVGEYVVSIQLIKSDGDVIEVILFFKSGRRLRIYHDQDCCEEVLLIDIVGGSLDELVGQEIKSIKSVSKNCLGEIKPNQKICIDRCLVPIIQLLWDNKIATLNCCCGHNVQKPTIIIDEKYIPQLMKLGFSHFSHSKYGLLDVYVEIIDLK